LGRRIKTSEYHFGFKTHPLLGMEGGDEESKCRQSGMIKDGFDIK
jgi:hypothetical protein